MCHVVVVQWRSKNCTKKHDVRAQLLFWSLNLLFFFFFFEVVVVVVVVVAYKLPNSWFPHDVTKIQTKKLSLLLSFYFHVILEHLMIKAFIQKNFRFKRVLCFAIQDAWISRLLLDAAFSWQPGKLLCGLKHYGFLEILLSNIPCLRMNITLIFMSSSSEEFTNK